MFVTRIGLALVAVAAILVSLWQLEAGRAGVTRSALAAGTTPATLYEMPGADGPLVVVAHGFAGSRQMMEGYALTLAKSGYRVVGFDFEGHGRNPVPMSGDVTVIEGTTARLVAETQAVVRAARALTGETRTALVGHSMASDIVIRTALADPLVEAVVAVSAYSEAITGQAPARLLLISGQGEPHLRQAALASLRQVDPSATEGETAQGPGVIRRAVVAPWVEHVGVLHSPTALREARDWLDAAFGRATAEPVTAPGPWLLLLLAGILLLARPVLGLLPAVAKPAPIPRARGAMAAFLPAMVAPLVLWPVGSPLLPVQGVAHLALHLALLGLMQVALLRGAGLGMSSRAVLTGLAPALWGIAVFGFALDRYGASFMPHEGRILPILLLALGAVPVMLGDALLRGAGMALHLAGRLALILSLGVAVALNPGQLFALFMAAPVVLLFFLVFGPLGRWTGRAGGPLAAGLGQGLILGWALGVALPLFAA
ncbi:alpha/beta fold hydrolase [Halovulum dunhuangense]|uniref:Alpha/beta fold hydrolase n=2 Tax=Halovulum dunhuangense TaxID=1505036 RepID=A0A849L3L7_9RHOB|nr:alpha/beta fold hydrolase [Halovulum dunhuangense]